MLGAQGMHVPDLPLAMQPCCLALRCSGGCSLYGGFKKLIGTSSFPTGLQKQPFRGAQPTPGLCAGLSGCQGLLRPPGWRLAQAVFGNVRHKDWHPCCYALSAKLRNFKAGAAEIGDFPLLEMLY